VGLVGWLEVAVLVDDLPLVTLSTVGVRDPERAAGERPSVHGHGEGGEPGRPGHVPGHVELNDLVGDVATARQAGCHRPERRLQLVPTALGRTDRREQADRVLVRPHLEPWADIATHQRCLGFMLPLGDQGSKGLTIAKALRLLGEIQAVEQR
jgi:hypothetical protein